MLTYICIHSLCSQIRTKLYNTETAWSNVRKKKVIISDIVVSSYTPISLLTMKNEVFLLKDP